MPFNVKAADIKAEKLDKSPETNFIGIVGDIVAGDAERFRRAALTNKDAVVFLSSNGGNTVEAIEIGKAIRLMGYKTYVSSQASCNSACALIWMGGSHRFIGKNAKIGFHASYLDTNGTVSESGVANAIVGNYFSLLNLPEDAVVFATSSPPNSLNYLTAENASAEGVQVEVLDDISDAQSKATTTEDSSGTTLFGSTGEWRVAIDSSLGGGCFLYTKYNDGTGLRLTYDLRGEPRLLLVVTNDKWVSIISDKEYAMELRINQNTPWNGKFTALHDGSKGLYISFPKEQFLSELSTSDYIILNYDRKAVTQLNTPGIHAAIEMLNKCNIGQMAKNDPFSK